MSASSGAPYAAHFDGRKWVAARVPVSGLRASATSPKNIWVAGFAKGSSSASPALGIMDFNGKTWRTTPAPGLGLTAKQAAFPTGIAALSATNVWMDGMILDSSSTGAPPKAFLLHWNGTKWAAVRVPYAGAQLASIAQDGHGGIWAGVMLLGSAAPAGYLAHYGAGAWTRVKAPARRGDITMPQALTWIPGTRSLWGLGEELPLNSTAPAPSVLLKYGA